MTRTVLLIALVGACHRSPAERVAIANASARAPQPDPCDMVEAMLAIDNDGYQKLYRACDGEARPPGTPRYVEVEAPLSLLPSTTRCPGRSFALYRGEPEVIWLIPRIHLSADGPPWHFGVSLDQPNAAPSPDGGFDQVNAYCGAMGGYVEWTGTHWRTFFDIDRGTRRR